MSNVGKMLVNGKPASVVGRVCMDQTMIDVTDVCCDVGDIVTVIGTDGENNVSASDIAVADGTINYEIVCRISSRVPRLYIKDGMIEKIKEYM
jgi:alanine racemase